jgi:hypothetical protein
VGEDRPSSSRVSVYEAAQHLGVTVDAIRKRISRNTIPHERDEDGRVWVILDAASKVHDTGQDTDQPPSDAGALISEMRSRIEDLREQLVEEREARRRADTIIAQLSQANAEQARTIRAIEAPASTGASSEAPGAPETSSETFRVVRGRPGPEEPHSEPEPREAPESAADEQQGRGPVPDAGEPQTARERSETAAGEGSSMREQPFPHEEERPQEGLERPWWRRMFGG